MKKYLIALPLVLIMILSMVPVMAAEDLVVNVSYYDTPNKTNVIQTKKVIVPVTDAEATDAKALKAKVEAAVKAEAFPKLNTEVQPEWTVEATVTVQTQADTTYDLATTPYTEGIEMVKLVAWAKDNKVTVTTTAVSQDDWDNKPFASAEMMTKVNNEITKVSKGETPAELKVNPATDMVKDAPKDPKHALAYLVPKAGAITAATASAVAFPKCFVDPKEEKESFCPELCEFIEVRVFNAYDGKELVSAAKKYKVDPQKLPTFQGIYDHYVRNYLPRGYQILKEWNLQNRVKFPTAINKDCTITIWVLPLEMKVNVYHVLQDCCIDLDGKVQYTVWKVFEELNQSVGFIEYHTDLVINHDKAKVYAATRLQKINATDFIFQDAFFDDGLRLDSYMTGEVYDLNGNKVAVIENENPSITILYTRAGCDKEEEQVDNATVENNANTQAPVTASGTQLPATGAKDVTAFFLSAVALLGLGIFFAKKH